MDIKAQFPPQTASMPAGEITIDGTVFADILAALERIEALLKAQNQPTQTITLQGELGPAGE